MDVDIMDKADGSVDQPVSQAVADAGDFLVRADEALGQQAEIAADAQQPADSEAQAAMADEEAAPAPYDYEAERAKKLAYRASLTDEDIARLRKHGRPENYRFGQKVVEGIAGTQESGDDEQRKRSAEELQREHQIEMAARVDDWQARLDGMSHEERVAATIECLGRRASFARVMRATLEYCQQEHLSEDVEAYIEGLPDYAANRQSARRYIFFLMRTGALEETGYDADGNPVDERSVAAVQEQLAPRPAPDMDADADQPEETLVEEAAAASADGAQADEPACMAGGQVLAQDVEGVQVAAGDGGALAGEMASEAASAGPADKPEASGQAAAETADGVEQQVAEDPEDRIVEWRIMITDAGREALESTDARGRLRTLLEGQAQDRYDAYLALITFCEEPRTLAEISEFLIGNPGLEIDDRGIIHMQPNAYIGKLDTAGALVWTGEGWQATPQALEVLESL